MSENMRPHKAFFFNLLFLLFHRLVSWTKKTSIDRDIFFSGSMSAWNERINKEDKQLLAHVINSRSQLRASSSAAVEVSGPSKPPSSISSSVQRHAISVQNQIAQSKLTGSSKQQQPQAQTSNGSVCGSVAPSVRSSSSTQMSHRGVSTVQGTSYSELSVFSNRLEQLEKKLEEERAERKRVFDELNQIKSLLLSNAKK
jgi:hypothetical protein